MLFFIELGNYWKIVNGKKINQGDFISENYQTLELNRIANKIEAKN